MRLLRRPLLALVMLGMLHQPAQASNEGKMCDGLRILVCVPLFMVVMPVAGVVGALKPKSPQEHLARALDDGDYDKAKRLLERHEELKRSKAADGVLMSAARRYIDASDETRSQKAFAMVEYLLDKDMVDVKDDIGRILLQETVPSSMSAPTPAEWTKRMTLARLALAHGASAKKVDVSYCVFCTREEAFLPLLIEHGVDINRGGASAGSLFDNFVNQENYLEAERLVRVGADPNGATVEGETILVRLAERCGKQEGANSMANWLSCTEKSVRQAVFAIRQGADPNGKLSADTGCLSPYTIASDRNNQLFTDMLVKLGADPERAAQCKRSLTPDAIAAFEKARAERKSCGCHKPARKPEPASVTAPAQAAETAPAQP